MQAQISIIFSPFREKMERIKLLGNGLALLLIIQAVNCARAPLELADYTVVNFLQDVQHLHPFDLLVFARNRNATIEFERRGVYTGNFPNVMLDMDDEAKFVRDVMTELEVSVVLFNEFSKFMLREHFSAALLVVVYLEESLSAQTSLLDTLAASLKHRTLSKILFLINSEGTTATCDDAFLQQLFQRCWLLKMINVVALCSDYKLTSLIYSYNHFPDFVLERKSLNAELLHRGPIYLNRLGNLRGYKLSYIIGGADPQIILYNDRGRRVLGGYAGHFLRNFARKHNCTIYEPLPTRSYTRFPPSPNLIAAVRNNTADISLGIIYPNISFDGFTYPYRQGSWCVWSPLEADIPNSEFFWIVFEGLALVLVMATLFIISFVLSCAFWQHGNKPDILRFFIHDACLRGILGQPFRELRRAPTVIRFIYLHIYVLGILLTTSYNSYFATYWTTAPKRAAIGSFDDILNSNMKIYIFEPEYKELITRGDDFQKYTPMFKIEKDYHRYLDTRDSFSTKYIYMLPTDKWIVFREKQKFFTTPLFRMRLDLCLYQNIPLCFPIQTDSIFSDKLNDMILETAQSGLAEFWKQMSYLELIRSGRLNSVDLGRKNEFRAMKIEDFKLIWIGYSVMCLVASLVFLAERYYLRR